MFESLTMAEVRPVRTFPTAQDRPAWDGLAAEDREQLIAMYEKLRSVPYPMCTAAEFLAFVRTGNRRVYEDPYFLRRRKLIASALHVCVTDTDEAMDDVVNGLWCICEETSWVISAHNVNAFPGARSAAEVPLPDAQNPYIDLFAAQTGMIVSIVCALLAARLDAVTPMLRRRVSREVEQRLLTPFLHRDDFWWMGFIRRDLCNWTPWILSNLLVTAGLEMTDGTRLKELTSRALGMLDRWLDCVPEDGGCDEGVGYWNMAGGALLDCLEWLEKASGLTFWEDEKLRAILSFPLKMRLGGGWFVNFADCDARPMLCGERLQAAGEHLHDPALVAMGCELRAAPGDELSDVPHLTRLLARLFHPRPPEGKPAEPEDVWLPDLQLRVVRRDGWILCCKGGHNGESHNHNDVGSFMLYQGGQPEIIDMGNMIYTAKTFSDQRYTLINTRSANHNVPLPGGREQACGQAHAASGVRTLENGLELEMAGAYPDGVERLHRTLTLEDGFVLRDEIRLEWPEPVTWVWMLRHRPVLGQGSACFGGVCLRFDAALAGQVEEIPVTDARMAASYPGSLWRLTLTAAPAAEHSQSFHVERKKDHE